MVLLGSCVVLSAADRYGPPRRIRQSEIPASVQGFAQLEGGRYLVARREAIDLIDAQNGRVISSIPVAGSYVATYDSERRQVHVTQSDSPAARIDTFDLDGSRRGSVSVALSDTRHESLRGLIGQGPGGRLFASSRAGISVVDLDQGKVTETWDLPGSQSVHAMRFDAATRRLYVARDGELRTLDSVSGKTLARLRLPVPQPMSEFSRRLLEFDASERRLICVGPDPEGRPDRAQVLIVAVPPDQPDRLQVVQEVITPGPILARRLPWMPYQDLWLDQRTHAFYLPLGILPGVASSPQFVVLEPVR